MIDTIEKWKRNSGEEWTVNRLKAMKQHVLNQIAGIQGDPPWISKHPDGSFKGAFRTLSKLETWKDKVKVLNTIMVYSTMVSTSPTPNQWRKFQASAENSPAETKPLGKDQEIKLVERLLPKFSFDSPRPTALDDLVLSEERRCPTWSPELGSLVTVPEIQVGDWLPSSCDSPFVRRMNSRHPVVFEKLSEDIGKYLSAMPSMFRYPLHDKRATADHVGKVSFIQEPGFKLRAVANPNRIVQCALQPLQRQLFGALRKLREDCTYNQESGVSWVSAQLKKGHTVHSIDLSDATNNFPLRLQMITLRTIMDPEWEPWLDLFEEASKGPWRVRDPQTGTEREFRWNKGQPLGLGPSFAAFALSHHLLARMACHKKDADYRILGDDIVIVGDHAAKMYLNLLRVYGCPISSSKTISSDRVAEFAGKIALRDEEPITPFKWREVSDRSFIDTARNLGVGAIPLFKRRQREVLHKISEIPEEFGGLGWNPLGLSFEERVERNLKVIRDLESARLYAAPYGVANQPVLEWRTRSQLEQGFRGNPFVQAPASASTRPAPMTVQTSPRLRILDIIRPRVEMFDEVESVPSDYRPVTRDGDPRGPSTLVVMERKLKSDEPNSAPKP
jgi:hypothetical protein